MVKFAGTMLAGAALLAGGSLAQAAPAPAKGAVSCPVMKAPVANVAKAPFMMVNNRKVSFCCAGCNTELAANPAKYLTAAVKDPVTGKAFKVTAKTPKLERNGALFLFSSAQTRATFEKDPAKYTKQG